MNHGYSWIFSIFKRPFDLRSFVGFLRLSDLRIGFAQRQETTPKTLAISTGDMGGFKVTEKRGESR